MAIISIENLSKRFGNFTAVDDISFDVPENSVFGFIGPNGAGKTTTMKLALGLMKPDAGKITVCGELVNFGETKTNRFMGYLPDVPEFYDFMNAPEYLTLCGRITGMEADDIKKRGYELIDMVGLGGVTKRIKTYSRGMKQRLGIAQALLNEPKLLICDEPTSALDPVGRREILEILLRVKGKTTVVFSTHILADVERICDRLAVIHKGKIVLNGTIQDIKSKYKAQGINIEFADAREMERFIGDPRIAPYMPKKMQNANMLALNANDVAEVQAAAINTLADLKIYSVVKFETTEPTIESLFLEVVK